MKLYTEEQVKNFLKERTFIREETIDAMCDTLTPIELPTDEEIRETSKKQWGNVHRTGVLGFIDCAKWLKQQILNQNK